ncbi:MAG: ATP-binding protein [Flammeovirgaceae bacterium]|jgi:uncharacterized protein|nr:ATP-binding protein [Flammeovirgaceae bacterium]
MAASTNPFLIKGYLDKNHFCDRGEETARLIKAMENGRNVTLSSIRRMGKTGLIYHVFSQLKKKNDCVYVDIMPTADLTDFTRTFGKAILNSLENPYQKSVKQLLGIFKRFTPTLSIDPATGQPSFEISVTTTKESDATLEDIFNYLRSRKKKVIIAIDEFQQILNYPEKRTEALLRSYIQRLNNVEFIFSGSQQHLLSQMFTNASRPFFQSTELHFLDRISKDAYRKFIIYHFASNQKKIKEQEINTLLEWTQLHTHYVQSLCNKLYTQPEKELTHEVLNRCMQDILLENETYYYSYQRLLTDQQWNLLKAIAQEEFVSKINQREFLNRYKLSASTVQRSIKALEEREMVIYEKDAYRIYDVFLGRWLAAKF